MYRYDNHDHDNNNNDARALTADACGHRDVYNRSQERGCEVVAHNVTLLIAHNVTLFGCA